MVRSTTEAGGTMKMPSIAGLDSNLDRVETELVTRMRSIFSRCPDLAGFSLQDQAGVPGTLVLSSAQEELFVTELGFSAPVSLGDYEEVYNLIADAVADMVSERPEAFELLRGRTFARTLH
jgi:hypothetical protein